MPVKVPEFWENSLERIESVAGTIKKGKTSVFAKSAGGRKIYLIEYGLKQDMSRKANYSSACSFGDVLSYAKKTDGIKPVILLVGGTHGGEIEGITAILNLINVLEIGKDFRGKEWKGISDIMCNYRILLIPCINPDGRARVPFNIVSEVSERDVMYYKQGTWKDGSLIGWEESFGVHPILDKAGFLGAYYNDDGVNLSVDNFFVPMAQETVSLMKIIDNEAPDFVALLHTGCHKHGKLIMGSYLPKFMIKKILDFDKKLERRFVDAGYGYYSLEEHASYQIHVKDYPPKRFSQSDAIHHMCGGMCVVYESNEAVDDVKDIYNLDNILDCHFMLFVEIFGVERSIV
jgi:hypothetical protein